MVVRLPSPYDKSYSGALALQETEALRQQVSALQKQVSSLTPTTSSQITRQAVDTTPITQAKDTPATSTTATTTPASTTQSSQLTPQNMPVALEQAGRDTTGSVILGGGAGTGGAYQGVADVPLGAAGQDNQFLRRAGSILLR